MSVSSWFCYKNSVKRRSKIWRNQIILFVEVKSNTTKWNFIFYYLVHWFANLRVFKKFIFYRCSLIFWGFVCFEFIFLNVLVFTCRVWITVMRVCYIFGHLYSTISAFAWRRKQFASEKYGIVSSILKEWEKVLVNAADIIRILKGG